MNTPAHLIFGLAAFGKPGKRAVIVGALAGSLLPDLSLYVMGGVALFVLGIPPERVFGELYFSPAWQLVFSIDNSLILWGLALAGALLARSAWAVALAGAALLHIGFDVLLHHDDGRPPFWPLSSWIFESPVSYWDPGHYGRIVGPIEMVVSLGLCAWLLRQYRSLAMRGLIIALGLAELAPVFVWAVMFAAPA